MFLYLLNINQHLSLYQAKFAYNLYVKIFLIKDIRKFQIIFKEEMKKMKILT